MGKAKAKKKKIQEQIHKKGGLKAKKKYGSNTLEGRTIRFGNSKAKKKSRRNSKAKKKSGRNSKAKKICKQIHKKGGGYGSRCIRKIWKQIHKKRGRLDLEIVEPKKNLEVDT